MDQHLKQRPNHYQTLGLKPGAKSEEIERAFARQLSAFTPRAFGSVAAVSVAYETLRDPARRRAYDQSIGISPPPPITRFTVPASGTMPFVGSRYTASRLAGFEAAPKAVAPPVEPQVIEPEPVAPVEPEAVEPEPVPPVADESVGHFLAQSQRLSSPEPLVVSPSPPKQSAPAAFTFEPNSESEAASIRPIVLGAVAMVAAAALFGAWMGMVSTEDVPETIEAAEVKADLPPAGPAAVAIEPAAPLILTDETAAVPPPAAPVRRLASERVRAAPPPVREEIVSAPVAATTELAEAPRTVAAEIVPASAARMPLGDATVARTIRKIGYPCGSVASTAAGSGAGVFVVTCTSGHSYRASPINGRYRFKRL